MPNEQQKKRKSKHVLRTKLEILKRKKGVIREYGPDSPYTKHSGPFTVLVNDYKHTTPAKVQECMSEYAKQWLVQLQKDIIKLEDGDAVTALIAIDTLIQKYLDQA